MEAPVWGRYMSEAKPVQLQVNNTGAWKNVCSFDADDHVGGVKVMQAADLLQQVDPSLKFRIATRDSLNEALMHLVKGEWKSVR